MNMKSVNGVLMMGSSEIAVVTDKEPKHVVRDIKTMLEQLGIYGPNLDDNDFKGFFISYKDYCGRTVIDEIWLNEDLSMTLITGYDPKRRLALIEQWQDMKRELSQPRIAAQPVQPEIGINPDFAALTRTVAEATAAGVMKSILETTGIQAVVHISATVSTPSTAPHMYHIGHGAEKPKNRSMCRSQSFLGYRIIRWNLPPAGHFLRPSELLHRWHSWALRASRIFHGGGRGPD
jgi:phage regulator Rha-like protein